MKALHDDQIPMHVRGTKESPSSARLVDGKANDATRGLGSTSWWVHSGDLEHSSALVH